jgi:uncharacterized membrane protein
VVVAASTGLVLVDDFDDSQSAQSKLEVVVTGSTGLLEVFEDSQSAQSKLEDVVTGSTDLLDVFDDSQSAQSKLDVVVAASTGLVLDDVQSSQWKLLAVEVTAAEELGLEDEPPGPCE